MNVRPMIDMAAKAGIRLHQIAGIVIDAEKKAKFIQGAQPKDRGEVTANINVLVNHYRQILLSAQHTNKRVKEPILMREHMLQYILNLLAWGNYFYNMHVFKTSWINDNLQASWGGVSQLNFYPYFW
jgi:hypothetical protein